jgi:uncharacterized membrane protein YozB (DUF420 family)
LTKEQKQLLLGIIIGFSMPVVGIFLMLLAHPQLETLQQYEAEVVKQVNVKLVTLGMLINAGLFFLFMRWQKEEISRGILLASVVCLLVIFGYRFL